MTYQGQGYDYYDHVDPNHLEYSSWNDGVPYLQYHNSSYGRSWPQLWDTYGSHNSQWQARDQPYEQDYYPSYRRDRISTDYETQRSSSRHRDSSPLPPPMPTEPSAEYLELSQQPSTHIDDPSSLRKLLILDLNGTLLYREVKPQSSRRYRRDRVNDSSEPQPRVMHPRPYMGSFRQYLFHPKTLKWLDTMVWSSAQPFNVNHMVDQCFEGEKEKLVAVWARDTLGLTSAQYHQKTQTTKNLAKPWATLYLLPDRDDQPSSISSSQVQPSRSVDELVPLNEPPDSVYVHSALTTLLLDDSPLKAHLQPWNHFCVPEYTAQIRSRDLATRQHERDKPHSDVQNEDATVSTKKRKRAKKQALGYDQVLLVVIGVLDRIKVESNVSGWMRQYGLWDGVHEEDQKEKSVQTPEETSVDDEVEILGDPTRKRSRRISDYAGLNDENSRPSDSDRPDSPSPAVEITFISPEKASLPSIAHMRGDISPFSSLLRTPMRDLTEVTSSSQPVPDDGSSSVRRNLISSLEEQSTSPYPPLSPLLQPSSQTAEHKSICPSPVLEAARFPELNCKSEANSPSESPQPPDGQHINPLFPSSMAEKDKLWFENEAVVSHWAKLGLEALAALGIPAEAGI